MRKYMKMRNKSSIYLTGNGQNFPCTAIRVINKTRNQTLGVKTNVFYPVS